MLKVPWTIPNIQKEDIKSIERVLKTGWLSMGKEVEQFEKKVSSYIDTKHAIAVNNGTAAIDVALKCLGIKVGDEVIIPSFTYVATANAVLYNHGTPVFVDIDESLNIDPDLIENKITTKTKAIMNIDFGGNVSNYSKLLRISKDFNIPLIVDGAQSFGSEYDGEQCCKQGLINTTSFHSAKIITTVEGGMVFTEDKSICEKARIIRNQGQTKRYIHSYLGNNYRMTDITAAMGNAQISRFRKTLRERMERAKYYQENLKNVTYPIALENTKNSYFLFIILVNQRDKLYRFLDKNGIETRINYSMPVNEQPILNNNEIYPMAKKMSKHVISLPLYHGITTEQQDYVIDKINNF